jgi:hypothetical protein
MKLSYYLPVISASYEVTFGYLFSISCALTYQHALFKFGDTVQKARRKGYPFMKIMTRTTLFQYKVSLKRGVNSNTR